MTKRTTLSTSSSREAPAENARETRDCPDPESQTDWARLEAMTPGEALQNALDDPDSQPLPPELRAKLRRVPNPQAIRASMGLTQEAFARRFQIALGTLRDWEQGVRMPDSTAKAYLRVIEANPDAVVAALNGEPPARARR